MKFASLAFAVLLLFAVGASAQTTNAVSAAEIEGQQLAQQLLEEAPTTNFEQKGVLKIRGSEGITTNVSVTFAAFFITNTWVANYYAFSTNENWHTEIFIIQHHNYTPAITYGVSVVVLTKEEKEGKSGFSIIPPYKPLTGNQLMASFADSDFWFVDLGLEFFDWPDQKIIKHETRRTRACAVLESTNPNPAPSAYSRVDSWIDNETLGVVHAEAFDANGKLLKVFDPKSFKKVNGQWELQDMDIRNVQTGSRTRIEFDLKTNSGATS